MNPRAWRPLPVTDWPEPDRSLWCAAIDTGDLLSGSGVAAHWRPATRMKYGEGYGRWLAFLASEDAAALGEAPASRVTANRLAHYLDSIAHKAPYTRFSAIDEMWAVLRIFARQVDYSLLRRTWRRLKIQAEQGTPRKNGRIFSSEKLAGAGLAHFAAASDIPFRAAKAAALQARDGLMIALLAHRPMRRRNFADLRIGHSLVASADGWRIVFAASAVKNRRAIDLPWPKSLLAPLETYLDVYRPILMQGNRTDYLWISGEATPMAAHTIGMRVTLITQRLVGAGVSPNLFRDCLATTMAIEDPDHVRAATVLLGHSTTRMVERHYNQARSIEAARHYQGVLQKLARDSRRR